MASASHLAELEIRGTDVVAAWNALEPVVAQCAGLLGTPATTSDYYVGHSDDQGTVGGADLRDCLDRVESPASISVTYTARSSSALTSKHRAEDHALPAFQGAECSTSHHRACGRANVGLVRADQKDAGRRD